MANPTYKLHIQLQNRQNEPLSGLCVQVWLDQPGPGPDVQVGEVTTNRAGMATLGFALAKEQTKNPPFAYLLIFDQGRIVHGDQDKPLYKIVSPETSVRLTLQMDPAGSGKQFSVKGTVKYAKGVAFPGAIVQAYDKDLCIETLLGRSITDANGAYFIIYHDSQLNRQKERADLLIKVFKAETEQPLVTSALILDAADAEQSDIVIPANVLPGPSAFELLQEKLRPFLTGRDLSCLKETDFVYLASKTSLSTANVGAIVRAKLLSKETKAAEEIFFAFAERQIPGDISELMQKTPEMLIEAVRRAATNNLIPPDWAEKAREEVLHFRKKAIRTHFPSNGVRPPLPELMTMGGIEPSASKAALERYAEFSSPDIEFWSALEKGEILPLSQAETVIKLATKSGLVYHQTELLKIIEKQKTLKEPNDLARLSVDKWEQLLTKDKIVPPAFVEGETLEERRRNFSKIIAERTEKRYPTTFFAHRLQEDKDLKKSFASMFFTRNPSFDFHATTVKKYLNAVPDALDNIPKSEQEGAIEEIKAFERLFKIAPDTGRFETLKPLWEAGLHSSLSVVQRGRAAFEEAFTEKMGRTAQEIFSRAEQVTGGAMHLMSVFGPAFNRISPAVIPNAAIAKPSENSDVNGVSRRGATEIPDLEGLFGSLDYCACQHCRSVYSPAAYLTDLLAFLKNSPSASLNYTDLKNALISRRPELAHIQLTCENTNTPVPYIDLVNEILENVVSADSNFMENQTTWTAEELKAMPEHHNPAAYDILKNAVYPWSLPLHLPLEEIRLYLGHLGVAFPRLLETLPNTLTPAQLAAEYLGFSEKERVVLITPQSYAQEATTFYHVPHADLLFQGTNAFSVEKLLKHGHLDYATFAECLKAPFVNPSAAEVLFPDADCKLETAQLDADSIFPTRLHRFLRLQRKSGWSIMELQKVMTAFQITAPGHITDSFFVLMAGIRRLQVRLNLPLNELLSWWSPIETLDYEEKMPSLYRKIFLNRAVNNPVVEKFELDAAGTELADPSPDLADPELTAYILGAVRLNATDFALLLDSDEIPPLAGTKHLNLANLSHAFRVASFTRALGISVEDYLRLRSLTGINLITRPSTPNTPASPGDTLAFLTAYDTLLGSGLSLEEVSFVLKHDLPAKSVGLPDDTANQNFLEKIREGLKRVKADFEKQIDPTGQASDIERLQNAVKILPAPAAPARILSIIEGRSGLSVVDQNDEIDQLPPAFFNIPVIKTNLTGQNQLTSLPARYDFMREGLINAQQALLNNLVKAPLKKYLKETFSEELGIDAVECGQLLNEWVKVNTVLVQEHFLNNAFIDSTDPVSSSDSAFEPVYKALKLLQKIVLIIQKMGLRHSELPFLFVNKPTNWLDINSLPVESGGAAASFDAWLRVAKTLALNRVAVPADFSFIELLDQAASGATPAVVFENLSEGTAWPVGDIVYLVQGFNYATVDLENEAWLLRLADAFEILRPLGVSAAIAGSWASIDPTPAMAIAVRNSVKAKYDLPQWLSVAPPLRDRLRERQRDGLVAWILGEYPMAFKDENDLFSYFLVDTQMSACGQTTRIVLAYTTIQLFIQRVMMNLESPLTLTPARMEEWKWVGRYRVWEAARKIFLWPENWLRPELRDDKSLFFREMEDELQQDDLNDAVAERVFKNYLEKLDEVAFLEIAGTFHEKDDAEGVNVLHVFARTKSHPQIYYYRRWVNESYWTGWERVELDIEGDHIVPVVFRKRVMLFWLQFMVKAKEENPTIIPASPQKYLEIRLFHSELKHSKWAAKKLTKAMVSTKATPETYLDVKTWYAAPRIDANGLAIMVVADIEGGIDNGEYDGRIGEFSFASCTSEPIITHLDLTESFSNNDLKNLKWFRNPMWIGNKYSHMKFHERVELNWQSFIGTNSDGTWAGLILKKSVNKYHLTFPINNGWYTDDEPFFYENNQRAFLGFTRLDSWFINTRFYRFFNFHHPYVCLFQKILNKRGLEGLLKPSINSADPEETALRYQEISSEFFVNDYEPTGWVLPDFPKQEISFALTDGYALYNWELFFHTPFMIACRLSENQRFAEAQKWFHYIFDPTETAGIAPARYWRVKPFHEFSGYTSAQEVMDALAANEQEVEKQVELWRKSPFSPHLLARMRVVSYMKDVVMKYLDNLIAWGDYLFRQDSMESINEATQLYILADQILGRRPLRFTRKDVSSQSFSELEGGLDAFSNALVELENSGYVSSGDGGTGVVVGTHTTDTHTLFNGSVFGSFNGGLTSLTSIFTLTQTASGTTGGALNRDASLPIEVLYFCIPDNDRLYRYWDTVEDRLFKIRHCLNIEGVRRQLALFSAPIDPAALVQAAAGGMDIGAALADLNTPLPLYRFQFMLQKAIELTAEVKSLGAAMLQAIEKKDAEKLSLIRAGHEVSLNKMVLEMKKQAIEEAEQNIQAIFNSKQMAEEREKYYSSRVSINSKEEQHLKKLERAIVLQTISQGLGLIAGATAPIPDVYIGVAGMSSPLAYSKVTGGEKISPVPQIAAGVLSTLAAIENHSANKALIKAGYERRQDDWTFQAGQAAIEIQQLETQLVAARIRKSLAERDMATVERQIGQAEEVALFMKEKFSNEKLYDWMSSQLSTLHFQTYNLAYDLAKLAEKTYRHELVIADSAPKIIQFGQWDSLKKGLLSGDLLYKDLKRLENAYLEKNRRDYEITKHVSLAVLDPVALINLKEQGFCDFNIPEILFDLDFPGQYMRRIKSVSLTIPCVTGPYTNVSAKLSLTANRVRKNADASAYQYTGINDLNFQHNLVGIQSIATSSAQNDSGLFQLNFDDSRYLPFEGAGAISSWRLELPNEFRQFDYDTISDVIIHLKFMAKDGGATLKTKVEGHLNAKINQMLDELADPTDDTLKRVFSLKQEFPDAFFQLQQTDDTGELTISRKHFPYFFKGKGISINNVAIAFVVKDGVTTFTAPSTMTWKIRAKSGPANNQEFIFPDAVKNYPVPLFTANPAFGNLLARYVFGSSPLPTSPGITNIDEILSYGLSLDFAPEEIDDILIILDYHLG